MMNQKPQQRPRIVRGTTNVFADLGFSDAAERQAKLRLAYFVTVARSRRELTNAAAAKVLGVSQVDLRALRSYKLGAFSRSPS